MVESGAREKIVLTVSAAPSPWSDDYLSIVEFDLEFRCVLPLKRTTWRQSWRGIYEGPDDCTIFQLAIAQT